MSIEGVTNYEYMNRSLQRTGWEKLERIDYCDQGTREDTHGWVNRIVAFFHKFL